VLTLTTLSGCSSDHATVKVFLRADLSRATAVAHAPAILRDVHLQPAGHELFQDHRISEEWVPIPLRRPKLDLARTGERGRLIAAGPIPSGAWDRAFPRLRSLDTQDGRGESLPTEDVLEAIALPFVAERGRTYVLRIDVMLMPAPSQEERSFSLFMKHAEIVE
jgi:hypothetical protein